MTTVLTNANANFAEPYRSRQKFPSQYEPSPAPNLVDCPNMVRFGRSFHRRLQPRVLVVSVPSTALHLAHAIFHHVIGHERS